MDCNPFFTGWDAEIACQGELRPGNVMFSVFVGLTGPSNTRALGQEGFNCKQYQLL